MPALDLWPDCCPRCLSIDVLIGDGTQARCLFCKSLWQQNNREIYVFHTVSPAFRELVSHIEFGNKTVMTDLETVLKMNDQRRRLMERLSLLTAFATL